MVYRRIGRLDFNANGECEFVDSSARRVRAIVAGVRIAGRVGEVAAALRAKGFALRPGKPPRDQKNTYYCDELGIVFSPDPDVDPEQIGVVGVWRPGVWEKYAGPSGSEAAQ